jgi:hypothetical protein
MPAMKFELESELDEDGRWLADAPQLPDRKRRGR